MGQSFNSTDISSAISKTHRAQRRFEDTMRLIRGAGDRRRSSSFDGNIDDDATSETEASTISVLYSENIYDDNTFESCLIGEMMSVALDQN